MSKQDNFGEDNSYITYNSLISISHISTEENDKLKTTKYIMRKENFSSFLVFKKINKLKFDYLNLSDSLFFIRDIEECNSIYGNKTKDNEDSICSKEVHFSKNDKLNPNSKFILQHMLSRKFVTCIMNIKNNTITLKLVKDVENTYPFTLEKINQNRNLVGDLKFNQIFFLNVYIEEENMHYYVEEAELCELKREKSHLNILPKIDDEIEENIKINVHNDYDEIALNRKPICGIYLVNQTYIINDKINIYYGHLLNITFTKKYLEKEEKMMLCLKEKDHKNFSKNNIINNFKSKGDIDKEKDDELDKNNYEISACVYTNELCNQVLNNALWVIESDLFYHKGGLNIKLVNIQENFRLRNALTGFYLDIKPKNLKSIRNILISKIFLESEKYEFQFNLIDGNKIEENLFFPYNFKLCHYIISDENTHVINDGKYILKGIFQNMDKEHVFKKEVDGNKFYYVDVDKYYLPISLYFKSGNLKRSLIKDSEALNPNTNTKKNFILTIKNENDFIFNIKQIDILIISQVIYIRKIILQLEKDLKNNNINLNSLNERVIFLKEYLINIDYSFKDENQEKNSPISERQKILWKFNIVNILVSVIDYCLEKLSNNNELIKSQTFFLENVKGLLSYLAKGEEAIKISIYVLALKKIFILEESLSNDCSKLVHFIFDLVHHSEILQTYLIGDSSYLKKYIQNDSCLSKMNIDIDKLINKNDILELIETNPNFLLCYQNLLILNKVQYKKSDIIEDIKRHFQQIKFKEENNQFSEKLNYLQSINEHYNRIKFLIKNNAILINKFLDQPFFLAKGKNKLKNSKFFSSLISFNNKELKNKVSTYVPNKKLDHSKSQVLRQLTIKTEQINLEDEDNEINKIPQMDTFRALISLESKEVDKNMENNTIKERNSCTISKDKEKQILLESPTIEEKDIIKRSSLASPKMKKYKYQRTPSKFIMSIKKTKGQEKEKNDFNNLEDEKKLKLRYKNTLNNFGKIWAFIKWYKTFGFQELICILEDVLKEILNENIDCQSKPLYYFIKYKKSSTFLDKNLRINSSTKVGVLYLLRLFNHLFKISQSELDEKILNKENISYREILDDMNEKEETLDEKYTKYQTLNDYDEKLNIDITEIDELMGVFYSTYQFYINQYVKLIHKMLSILSNYLINQETFDSIEKIKICFMKTLDILLSKVVFLNDTTIGFLYSRARRNPTILSGVFNYKELLEHSIEIIVNNFKKTKQTQSLGNFIIQEKILIDYLYSMCRECDEIKCLYEKITCLKYMRDFIFERENMIENFNDDKFNEEVKKQFKNMLKLIWEKKRIKILLAYEEYNSKSKYQLTDKQKKKLKIINSKFEQVDFWENYFYESFKVGDITKFTLKLLKLYEIDEFFGNILYFDRSNNDYFYEKEDRSIKKIRKLISQISKIERQIINLKINSNKEDKIMKNHSFNDSTILFESDDYKSLYHTLAQITTDSLEVFNFELYNFKSKNLLYNMLIMENKLFYQKIEFLESLKNMIQAINYFKINIDNNILGYLSNLLRIFSQMIIMYPNFSSTIKPNFEIFSSLVISAFHLISKYPNYLINQNVETAFLEIIYRGMLIFDYIVKNSFMTFKDIKEFMENVFMKIQLVFEKFKSEKNRYIFRILYLFCVSRILLYLYNDKTYDSLSYKEFYEKIFRISDINTIFSNNLNKVNNDSVSSSGKMETIKEEVLSQKESNLSEHIKKAKGNIFFDLNNFPEEMHPVKLETSNNLDISEQENSNDIKNNLEGIRTDTSQEISDEDKKNNDNNDLLINNTLDWYDEEEIKILSFYVSFLFIYSLYLNEKNSQINEFDEDNFDKQEAPIEEISLDIFLKKIKSFLTSKNNQVNTQQQQLINQTYDITMNSNTTKNITIDITKPKVEPSAFDFNCIEESSTEQTENEFKESVIKPQHLFIFALLQAILNFKHSSRNHPIEIPIKQYVSKMDSSEDSESEDIIPNESDTLFDKDSDNSSIIFYYYEASHIDIILLEKIITEIALKVNIKNYCLELAEGGNERVPPLLKELLHNLNYYNLMFNYQIKEYNLVNNLFVKNNLALLIKKIFSMFKFDDLKEISQMNYFMFKKMGEVYNEELIKQEDDNDHKNINLIEFLQFNEEVNKDFSKKINIISFMESLIYIDPKNEKICLILYKMGFQLLYNKCSSINKQKDDEEEEVDSSTNILNIIKIMISLFQKEKYKKILENEYVFGTMLLSLRELLQSTSEKFTFFLKQTNLIKEFLNSFDFILGHLSIEFVETMKFLRRPENLLESNNFHIHKIKLETNLEFFITLLNFQKKFEEKIMSEKIIDFEKKFIKRVIKLIFLILEIEKDKSIEIVNILIDFLFEFIKGPDIDNLNMIFSLGFFDLISYTIKNIDYYKLFLNYVNKDNMHKMIDSYIKIECKIIKFFIIYYNISFSPKNSIEYFYKLQQWYETNFKNIIKKLKKLYYISEKEMEGREYCVNKMLLSIKKNDSYSSKEMCKRIGVSTSNQNNNKDNKINNNAKSNQENNENEDNNKCPLSNIDNENNVEQNSDYCIIKFDIIMAYYILFNYHKNLSDKDKKFKFALKHKNNIFVKIGLIIFNLLYDFFKFVIGTISILMPFMYYIFNKCVPKSKKDVDLLQDLQDIDIKCENIREEKIINFLKNYIKRLEVSIKNIIYKVYFPMIDKANTLAEYRKEYLKVDEIDSADFTNYLLSQYDYIYMKAKQNSKIDRWIGEIPILSYIFKNMNMFAVFLIITGLGSTFLILSSFNTFTSKNERECGKHFIVYQYARVEKRLQCPRFLYKANYDPRKVAIVIFIFILLQCILQGLTFMNYLIRKIFIESEIVKFNYISGILRKYGTNADITISKWNFILHIILPTFLRSLFNIQTIYYLISLTFLVLSSIVHPFFNCIILLELVYRVEVMQNILKAMYRPSKNILIILLMFIILEYFFSFLAQSYFTLHFPNITDTKNFLKTFMRMIDQTFKQDGGIGTYLDKTLEPNYLGHEVTKKYINRFIFDILFFLVVVSLIFQMFLSVIIDYFNETRERSETFNETMETECIICGISREKIEKINPNDKMAFDKHITNCHNVFNYLYYLMYLQSIADKDVIIDEGVWNLHLDKNLSYLPKNEFFKNLERKRWEKYNSRKKDEDK